MVLRLDRFPFLGTGNLWTRFLDLESILVGLLSVGLICGRCFLLWWTPFCKHIWNCDLLLVVSRKYKQAGEKAVASCH